MNLKFTINATEYDLTMEQVGEAWNIAGLEEAAQITKLRMLPGGVIEYSIPAEIEGSRRTVRIPFAKSKKGTDFSFQGRVFNSAKAEAGTRRERKRATGDLTAPMMGVVVDVLVTEGQQVQAHDPLAVMEAMKVMATIEAPFAGRVTKVFFAKGAVAAHGDVIVAMEPLETITEAAS